jgi:mRNA interferase MazF
MITTLGKGPWPGDTPIEELPAAGLPRPCMVRLKLFTLDARLIRKRLGALAQNDIRAAEGALRSFLP